MMNQPFLSQLLNIDSNLEEISDHFLELDEALAVHIETAEETTPSSQTANDLDLGGEEVNLTAFLDEVAYDATPFDAWLNDRNLMMGTEEAVFDHFPLEDVFRDSEPVKPVKEEAKDDVEVGQIFTRLTVTKPLLKASILV